MQKILPRPDNLENIDSLLFLLSVVAVQLQSFVASSCFNCVYFAVRFWWPVCEPTSGLTRDQISQDLGFMISTTDHPDNSLFFF